MQLKRKEGNGEEERRERGEKGGGRREEERGKRDGKREVAGDKEEGYGCNGDGARWLGIF